MAVNRARPASSAARARRGSPAHDDRVGANRDALAQNKAVFLDKDGTLVTNVPYNVDPARVELTFGAARALRRLADAGFALIVVSNQPGIAEGRFERGALDAVERRIQALLAEAGVAIDDFYYCPHLPVATSAAGAPTRRAPRPCRCRKPAPGLLHRAAKRWRVDLARSWLVGDILDDVEAGRRAGCSTVLIANGNETEWQLTPERRPDWYARNLWQAARVITQDGATDAEGLPVRRAKRTRLATLMRS